MRIICSLVAASMLMALSSPAWAVCVIRGGATTCTRDPNTPKYANSAIGARMATPAKTPNPNAKTIVLQPSGTSSDAWVLAPESTAGAAVLGGKSPAAFICGPGTKC